jgi:excisionase family DNA binding protein
MSDWASRIGRHMTAEGSVVVPARIAAWLEQRAGLTTDSRIRVRDTDPAAYEVLMALHAAALDHRSGTGTKLAGAQPSRQESETWLTTTEAASLLGVTDRAVRKWIARGRLPATRHGGRWLINRAHLHLQAFTA